MTPFIEDFEAGKIKLKLMAPGILVKVLPRPAMLGILYIPEEHRNSVNREAIVMQVFEPRTMLIGKREVHLSPTLEVGDRVLIPWWAGIPLDGISDKDESCPYRIVSDRTPLDQFDKRSPQPFVKIESDEGNFAESDTLDWAKNTMLGFYPEMANSMSCMDGLAQIIENIYRDNHVIPRTTETLVESSTPHKQRD